MYTGLLKIINSKTDLNGNRYWSFQYTDFATEKNVEAANCGGESNINHILFNWNGDNDYCRTIMVARLELSIREYNRMTKGWPYAGATPDELRTFIKSKLLET